MKIKSNVQLTVKITVNLLAILLAVTAMAQAENLYARAQSIHQRALTLDSHVDIPGAGYGTGELDPGINNPRLRCDLVKMEMGGMDAVFLAVFVSQSKQLNAEEYDKARDKAGAQFEAIHRVVEELYPRRCTLAASADEVERIVSEGRKAIIIGLENGSPVGKDLAYLDRYHELGTQYITLCHTAHNQICDSSSPDQPLHGGLSDFGRTVIERMNQLGIMCDASHISEKSFFDLMEVSRAPIIASHSGCSAIYTHDRNLTDNQLRALACNGGVIQVVTLEQYLGPESLEREAAMNALRVEVGIPTREEWRLMTDEQLAVIRPKLEGYYARRRKISAAHPIATISDYVDHIDHAVKIAGIDHVGVGTDFDGGGGCKGFADHSQAFNVTLELVKRDYSDEDIIKIWGGNFLRVWREVDAVAQSQLPATSQP